MRVFFSFLCIAFLSSCAVFQPKNFSEEALQEELQTVDRNSIDFKEVITKNNQQKKFIQFYASYCPVSQDSFKDVVAFQEEHKDFEYIFLSVDHSYHDWKRGLESLKVEGLHYYIPKKGKGSLGEFLKLKTIPRFMLVDEAGNISIFKTSKVSDINKKINQ